MLFPGRFILIESVDSCFLGHCILSISVVSTLFASHSKLINTVYKEEKEMLKGDTTTQVLTPRKKVISLIVQAFAFIYLIYLLLFSFMKIDWGSYFRKFGPCILG